VAGIGTVVRTLARLHWIVLVHVESEQQCGVALRSVGP
jgi:hypothetical protein